MFKAEDEIMKKAFFFGTSSNPNIDEQCRRNYEYSNFVYAACLDTLRHIDAEYDITYFKRHDMLDVDNIRDSVYKCMLEYDTFIVLVDQDDGSYNANVWFELGLISTQKNKTIILISKDYQKNFPFYIADVDVVIIDRPIYDWFDRKRSDFDTLSAVTDLKNPYSFLDITDKDLLNSFSGFNNSLKAKLLHGKNPFSTQVNLAQLNALGYGDLYELFKNSNIIDSIKNGSVLAEFIEGEDAAFIALEKAVKTASVSLRTTRSANQSIVAGTDRNNTVHNSFMTTLCEKSKSIPKCDRIICNNAPEKWHDVFKIFMDGGQETRVFIRKENYALGFELVVIDKKVSFIHFYHHSDDSLNDDASCQKINSTLKIIGENVSSHLADLFDRFHHRDFHNKGKDGARDPSRTLLGIPDELIDKKNESIGEYYDRGCLKLPNDTPCVVEGDEASRISRSKAINAYLLSTFKKWQKDMLPNDRINMAIGISSLSEKNAGIISGQFDELFYDVKENKKVRLRRIIDEYC